MWQIIPLRVERIPVGFVVLGPARRGNSINRGWQVMRLHWHPRWLVELAIATLTHLHGRSARHD